MGILLLLAWILPWLVAAESKKNPSPAILNFDDDLFENTEQYGVNIDDWPSKHIFAAENPGRDSSNVKEYALANGELENNSLGEAFKGLLSGFKDILTIVFRNVKNRFFPGYSQLHLRVTTPSMWSTERLRLYLSVRGVDTSKYTHGEMVGMATLVLGRSESFEGLETIFDSWPNSKLKLLTGEVETDSHVKLVEIAAITFDETLKKMNTDEKSRRFFRQHIIGSSKSQLFDNFNTWTDHELVEYLDSYGAVSPRDMRVKVAKANYYHFACGCNNNRKGFLRRLARKLSFSF